MRVLSTKFNLRLRRISFGNQHFAKRYCSFEKPDQLEEASETFLTSLKFLPAQRKELSAACPHLKSYSGLDAAVSTVECMFKMGMTGEHARAAILKWPELLVFSDKKNLLASDDSLEDFKSVLNDFGIDSIPEFITEHPLVLAQSPDVLSRLPESLGPVGVESDKFLKMFLEKALERSIESKSGFDNWCILDTPTNGIAKAQLFESLLKKSAKSTILDNSFIFSKALPSSYFKHLVGLFCGTLQWSEADLFRQNGDIMRAQPVSVFARSAFAHENNTEIPFEALLGDDESFCGHFSHLVQEDYYAFVLELFKRDLDSIASIITRNTKKSTTEVYCNQLPALPDGTHINADDLNLVLEITKPPGKSKKASIPGKGKRQKRNTNIDPSPTFSFPWRALHLHTCMGFQ
eukprot:257823_1